MRDALLLDFMALADVEIIITYDVRQGLPQFEGISVPRLQAIAVDAHSNVPAIWSEILQSCDAALIVAPETNGILSNLTRLLDASGVINLGCGQHAVDLTSHKINTYQQLTQAGILTIPTQTATAFLADDCLDSEPDQHGSLDQGVVLKPNDGAGCDHTYVFPNAATLRTYLNARKESVEWENAIVQPYQVGLPASISMLCQHGQAWVLSCNQQNIQLKALPTLQPDIDVKSIGYHGAIVNGLVQHWAAFSTLANKIAAAIPSLNGYVGVDVIIHDQDLYVVEINPRITTSYVALSASLDLNPARLIVDLATIKAAAQNNPLLKTMSCHAVEVILNDE